MITPEQKQTVKSILGKQYSKSIITHLLKKGFSAPGGGNFTMNIIQNIVTGRTENLPIELEIVALVKKVKKQRVAINTVLEQKK
jgi:hypothetical protein